MRIHQLLYGYRNGHGLIAGSISPPPLNDSLLLSKLTDWSGFVSQNGDDEAYLTGTFLKESNLYAVSLTWYASEMERTGCVWTHVLLFNPDQISSTFDFRYLLPLFSRPSEFNHHNFGVDIFLEEQLEVKNDALHNWDIKWIQIMFSLLLSNKGVPLYEEKRQQEYHELILSMLNFVPQDILKTISITTGYTSKLDQLNLEFGVIITQDHESFDSTDFNSFEKLYHYIPDGIKYLAASIYCGNNQIVPLIRYFSTDIRDSIFKLGAVGNLLCLFEPSHNNIPGKKRLCSVLEIIDEYFPDYKDGIRIKDSFLREDLSSCFISEEDFFYIVSTFYKSVRFCSKQEFLTRLNKFQQSNPSKFIDLIERLLHSNLNSYGKTIISFSLNHLENEGLRAVFDTNFENSLPYIINNKRFLISGDWLKFTNHNILRLLPNVSNTILSEIGIWDRLIPVIDTKAFQIPPNLSEALDTTDYNWFFDVFNAHNKLFNKTSLLEKAITKENKVVQWVAQTSAISKALKLYIVQHLNPNSSYIKIMGEDVWYNFADSESESLVKSLPIQIFCFKLGFNWGIGLAVNYIKDSFYILHEKLKDERYNEYIWNGISDFCSDVMGVFNWDRCGIIRKKVVTHFIKNDIPKSVLINFTPDEKLNKALIKIYDRLS